MLVSIRRVALPAIVMILFVGGPLSETRARGAALSVEPYRKAAARLIGGDRHATNRTGGGSVLIGLGDSLTHGTMDGTKMVILPQEVLQRPG